MESRTQHCDKFLHQESRVVVVDMVCDVTDPYDIVSFVEVFLDCAPEVASLIQSHVLGQPFRWWGKRKVEIEAVELDRGTKFLSQINEPDAGSIS